MNFTLYYRGGLKANGGTTEKHALRKHFHLQLKQLWQQPPLTYFDSFYASGGGHAGSIAHQIGAFRFVPLVCTGLHLVARLEITLLRPEPAGSLVVSGGDIDNRVKTLLDSLKIPDPNALPRDANPEAGEDPFFCLLEDDSLVTELEVRTRQLLEPGTSRGEVVVLLEVHTDKTETLMEGMELP